MKYKSLLLLLTAASFSTEAFALGAVSRACKFSDIPSALKSVAGQFFVAIGGAPIAKDLPNRSLSEQATYWIMESLTTDYVRQRYYLYAETTSYTKNPYPESANYNKWQISGGDVSTIWTAETVSDALKADPRFSPYWANRGPLFSARAGDARIVVYYASVAGVQRATIGHHWYYDPVSKVTSRMSDTVAFDCNLGDWGYGKGIFDR